MFASQHKFNSPCAPGHRFGFHDHQTSLILETTSITTAPTIYLEGETHNYTVLPPSDCAFIPDETVDAIEDTVEGVHECHVESLYLHDDTEGTPSCGNPLTDPAPVPTIAALSVPETINPLKQPHKRRTKKIVRADLSKPIVIQPDKRGKFWIMGQNIEVLQSTEGDIVTYTYKDGEAVFPAE